MATLPKKLDKTPEALAQRLLEDPNTAKIAEKLKMPLQEYLALVVHYTLNPNEQPMLNIVKDEDLIKHGHTPPTADAINAYMEETVAVAEAATGSGFTDAKKVPVSMSNLEPVGFDASTVDPALAEELKKAVLKGRGGKR